MKLALGTAQFGLDYGVANTQGQISQAEITKLLGLCKDHGVNMLDTAPSYGDSEVRLGACDLDGLQIITKIGAIPDNCNDLKGWFESSLIKSVERLNVKKIYAILLHRPNHLLGDKGLALYNLLMEAKKSGLVEKIGVSVYSPSEIDLVFNKYYFDIVQSPFNVFDQRIRTSGWLYKLKLKEVEIHVRSIYLQGLLLMEKTRLPHRFSRWAYHFDRWYDWLRDNKVSAMEACLKNVLSNSEIDRAIIGVDSIEQFMQTINAFNLPVTGEIPDLESKSEELINPSCWG